MAHVTCQAPTQLPVQCQHKRLIKQRISFTRQHRTLDKLLRGSWLNIWMCCVSSDLCMMSRSSRCCGLVANPPGVQRWGDPSWLRLLSMRPSAAKTWLALPEVEFAGCTWGGSYKKRRGHKVGGQTQAAVLVSNKLEYDKLWDNLRMMLKYSERLASSSLKTPCMSYAVLVGTMATAQPTSRCFRHHRVCQ